MKVGDRFQMRVPALGDKLITAEIRLIAAKGEYAGWRATRATGDFDLRTFAIRAYPVTPIPELRPGMSVYAAWPDNQPMRAPARPGMLLVATRELRWMRRDRLALFLAIGVPIIAFAILAGIFSNAVVRNLRVSVVDADRSSTSLTYVQAIASAPGVTVAQRYGDMTSAMHAIRSGDAIAAVYIPENFERDLTDRKRPQIVVLYNRQYFSPGNSASAAISNALSAATATLPDTSPAAGKSFAPGSLVVEEYVLTNPALNYAQFLLRAILPHVLHVVVAIAAGYAVGSEFSRRSQRAWLRAAGGSPLAALVGKLTPLFGIFILMMVVDAAIVHGLFA